MTGAESPRSPHEQLTQQFYEWERRGRGWETWPFPVRLEPPFRPFFHSLPSLDATRDDGRSPTVWSTFIDWLLPNRLGQDMGVIEMEEPAPEPFDAQEEIVEILITLPEDLSFHPDLAGQFLLCLSTQPRPMALEFIGTTDAVFAQLTCHEADSSAVITQINAFFPDAAVSSHHGQLPSLWSAHSGDGLIVDFGLSEEFMLPLQVDHRTDPLIGVAGALSDLNEAEVGLLQILWEPTVNLWADSIFRAVTDDTGSPFFSNAPEMVRQAKRKISSPLWAVSVRVAIKSPRQDRTWDIARGLAASLTQLSDPVGNTLIPLSNDDYPDELHASDLLHRCSRRHGMLLNTDELVTLLHFPSEAVRSPKLQRLRHRTWAAPECTTGNTIALGQNEHAGQAREVTLSEGHRIRHTHVIGASGTGKSTLLLRLILQDIEQGHGVAVLDPHGDLIDALLPRLPESRIGDVIFFDPADMDHPIPFNILHAHSDIERELLASDLGAVFRRLSTSWGDQMTSVLGNAIIAILESEQGGSLVDLRRFLVDREFRRRFLETVRDPEIVYYWQREFPLLSGRPQAPILTRLDAFLRPKIIRHIVGQPESRLDFASFMDEGKIFLGKLAEGLIGQENAHLLGAFLVSKFQQIALSRQEQAVESRRPFFLHIDEFHRFATPTLTQLLSGARKYRLGLVLAHQEMRQLGTLDSELTSAVTSNSCTRICFRLGDQDARRLAAGFAHFTAEDLQSLSVGEALARVERAEWDFNLRTRPLDEVEPEMARERHQQIVAASRAQWAVPRVEVEARLAEQWGRSEKESVPPAPQQDTPPRSSPVTSSTPGASAESDRPRPPRAQPLDIPQPPAALGRGGPQHRYLQNLIKRWADGMGWRAVIEEQILGGTGSVDVALEREGVKIACEISVTSTPGQELGNITKCLSAGFSHVTVVSADDKALRRLRGSIEDQLTKTQRERVRFLTPDALFSFIEKIQAKMANTETTVRGRKVRVRHRAVSDDQKAAKSRAISETMMKSLRRLKK